MKIPLRKIFDSITIHVCGLESLGTAPESYGNLLIPIFMSRMPKDVTLQDGSKEQDSTYNGKSGGESNIITATAPEIGPATNNNSLCLCEKQGGQDRSSNSLR